MEGGSGIITKNIIIAIPDIYFAEQMKKKSEIKGLKVVEIIVILEHLLPSIDEMFLKGVTINGIILSSSISKNIQGKRLELLADTILTIRERHSNIQFIFLSDENEGHPLLAELVSFGIYNIFTRDASGNLDIAEFLELLNKPKTFAEGIKFRKINPDIRWRNESASLGAKSIHAVIESTVKPIEKNIERERIVEKQVVQIIEKDRVFRVEPKLITIGSAYPAAGSTFIMLALSRILHFIGINNAVVEHPVVDPELNSLLFGDSKCPKGYKYLSEQVEQKGNVINWKIDWTDGNTTWYPLNPQGVKRSNEWSNDDTLKMLFHIKEPIILLDVSHKWYEPSVRDICLSSDEILFVVDPHLPIRYYRQDTKKNTDIIFEVGRLGKPINIIANRDVKVRNRNEWLNSLPLTPISVIPEFPYSEVIESMWGSRFIADDEAIRGDLINALIEVIKLMVPKDYPINKIKKQRRGGPVAKLFSD